MSSNGDAGRTYGLSLQHPHEESDFVADLGLDDWAARAAEGETDALLDPLEGRNVEWRSGTGWTMAAGEG